MSAGDISRLQQMIDDVRRELVAKLERAEARIAELEAANPGKK